MARKKTSPLEDMIDIVAMLPWWVGVSIAIIGYLVLHGMAGPVQVGSVQPAQVGQLMTQTMIATFANIGQYIVPLVGLAGAVTSFFRREQRTALISSVAQSKSAKALDGMSWREFEMLVGEAYALQGYSVAETGGGGADGGVDLVLTKDGQKFLVQCKQWKSYRVGVAVVRELYGVMAAKRCAGGFVVTSGHFTDAAKAFAKGINVQLVDGTRLFAMIKQVKQSPSTMQQDTGVQSVEADVVARLGCPKCGSRMVLRTARKGGNTGSEFMGCSRFPTCRGVRQLS